MTPRRRCPPLVAALARAAVEALVGSVTRREPDPDPYGSRDAADELADAEHEHDDEPRCRCATPPRRCEPFDVYASTDAFDPSRRGRS